jgi:hypothetical protein
MQGQKAINGNRVENGAEAAVAGLLDEQDFAKLIPANE